MKSSLPEGAFLKKINERDAVPAGFLLAGTAFSL